VQHRSGSVLVSLARLAAWLAWPAASLAACGAQPGSRQPAVAAAPAPAPDLGPVVARVAGHPIHAAEVRAQAARDGVGSRAALDRLVAVLLLAERARERPGGLAAPPGAAGAPLLVQRLLERDFEPRSRPQDIPERDLRAAYESVKDHYVHPRMVEVGLLSVYTGPGMKPEPRARAEATARELNAQLRKQPPASLEAFSAMARDPAWSARKVRFQRMWQGPSRQFGNFGGKVAPAIQQLTRPGQMSPLIEDDSGYHVAWYLRDDPARDTPFEQAREEVRGKFYPVWRQQRFQALTHEAAAGHTVELHVDALSGMRPAGR
jgi:hypothetical protein